MMIHVRIDDSFKKTDRKKKKKNNEKPKINFTRNLRPSVW